MSSKEPNSIRIPRRRTRSVDPAHPVYELDAWLADSDPPIWRTLAVPADFTLELMHWVMQAAFDWDDSHLHAFQTKNGRRYQAKAEEHSSAVDRMWGDVMEGVEDESEWTLRHLFEELKQMLVYEYDFGDSWIHGIKLIRTHERAEEFEGVPICLAGEQAAPPEDCGGLWGYYEKLDIISDPDPNVEWHQEILEWMGCSDGETFDPKAFDIEAVNARLKFMQAPRAGGGLNAGK